MRALAPARVREVRIHEDSGTAEVIVPDFQLSLAIGKEGQNARLAARLTGWRVDIKSETQLQEEESGEPVEYAEGEWTRSESGELVWQPAGGGEAISAAEAGYAGIDASAVTVETPGDQPAAAEQPAEGKSAETDGEAAAADGGGAGTEGEGVDAEASPAEGEPVSVPEAPSPQPEEKEEGSG
jgi:N utilization substance protein A